jgi:hypothetical protein
LRRAFFPVDDYSLYHDACTEHLPYQSLDAFIADDLSYPAHQDVVIDPVEKLFDVQVHDAGFAFLDVLLCGSDGVMLPPSWPEPKAAVAKTCLPDGGEHAEQELLHETV